MDNLSHLWAVYSVENDISKSCITSCENRMIGKNLVLVISTDHLIDLDRVLFGVDRPTLYSFKSKEQTKD